MFRTALAFFTRLPVGVPRHSSLTGMTLWLPVVGLVVGGFAFAVMFGAGLIFPPLICGVLGAFAWAAVTGGLHLDGLADCGDGLVVEAPPEKRLEIMKDPNLGTFGGVALFFVLLLKASALATLAGQFSLWLIASACLLAGLIARSMALLAMYVKTARPGGLGEAVRNGSKLYHTIFATLLVLGACLWVGVFAWLALGVALAGTVCLLLVARKRLGGVTGDVFGGVIEVSECLVLLTFCLNP